MKISYILDFVTKLWTL